MTELDEAARAAALLDAQEKAQGLFAEIARSLIRPGVTESRLSEEIHALAARMYGVTNHWHKRVVRVGANTLSSFNDYPPDLAIGEDEILFVDLGPVFEAWEADFGRTYVLGNDPRKLRLRDDLEPVFRKVKARFKATPGMTGAALYAAACEAAEDAGWDFGGGIAGHLVGEFPHEKVPGNKTALYIVPGNDEPLDCRDAAGRKRHWILEIHLVDRVLGIGGFYEELLTIG